MVKEITNIFINTFQGLKNGDGEFTGDIIGINGKTVSVAGRIYSINFDIPPISIKNRANLKVANICHSGSGHGDSIILFKLDGIMTDSSKYIANDGGYPTIIATNFNNTRNLYEENDIPLVRQTINSIKLIVSDSLSNSRAGVANTLNFCISLKIEEEINE